jgi:hypothetical protein
MANLSRTHSQEEGPLPRSQAWWWKVITRISPNHTINRLRLRSVIAFDQSIGRHISTCRGYQGHYFSFLRSQRRAWETAFFGFVDISQQNDAHIRAMYKMYHKSCNPFIKAIVPEQLFFLSREPSLQSIYSPLAFLIIASRAITPESIPA